MREKVRDAHPVAAARFDLKHSPGGMMDVEFAVQYLVLAHGARIRELLDNVGNIALLQRAEAAGLLPPRVGAAAADAYRELRRAQHRARLDEQPTQVDPETMAAQSSAVLRCGGRCSAEPAALPAGARAWLGIALRSSPARCCAFGRPARDRLAAGAVRREPWRAFGAVVHYSRLHLVANLAGAALVGALGVAARCHCAWRSRGSWPGR